MSLVSSCSTNSHHTSTYLVACSCTIVMAIIVPKNSCIAHFPAIYRIQPAFLNQFSHFLAVMQLVALYNAPMGPTKGQSECPWWRIYASTGKCVRNGTKLLWTDGNAWGVLKGKLPKIARAEGTAEARIACELIYNSGTTLKGSYCPKPGLGPLTLLSLDSPSLNPPCYTELTCAEQLLNWVQIRWIWR